MTDEEEQRELLLGVVAAVAGIFLALLGLAG
jgi:hypothetical protein